MRDARNTPMLHCNIGGFMTLEQLIGKYMRLRGELSAAYAALSWDTGHLTRLDGEIASTSAAISQAQPLDEQTDETMPGVFQDTHEGAAGYSTPFGAGLIPEDGPAPR